ncbi:hypothetical protein RJ640_001043 [Escallonia rubra]|uniref:Peptidase A1 domain-containing protein n=1 Tax=Escallonia rubra TaxID=112253 RepID=A0AA88UAH0_9ASTE|nr:hypothetical protein RJ640_001043 [Escallonia rubra]
MAKHGSTVSLLKYYCFLLFTLTSSLLISSISSRTLSTHSTTHLDVSASLHRAKQVLSFASVSTTLNLNQTEQQEAQLAETPSSPFSLTLHPRASLAKPHHKDYQTLTLSRLARDSARVDSLNSRLHFALAGLKTSDLKPVEAVIQPNDLSSPVTSGISQGSGEYFARIGVGQPAKPFYMVPDTGSDVTWLQCKPCSDCYQQSDPVFDPVASSTYSPLSCTSQQCSSLDVSACRSESCLYQVSYGDGSYTVGEFVTETVSFGQSGSVPKLAIGCGHDNEGLFVGSAGLIGMGLGALSLPTQIKASSFSYCFVNRDSSSASTLEFNSVRPGDSVTAPLLRNSKVKTFFYVGLTGFDVGGEMVSIPPSLFEVDESGKGGIIVDSGTAVTRLQAQAYNSLRDAFVKAAQNLPSTTGFSLFDTCYDLSSMRSVKVPTVSFVFAGGKKLGLKPENYLVPVDSAGKFCFAFAPTSGSLSIIGNLQQQGTRVTYAIADSLVAFSPNKC